MISQHIVEINFASIKRTELAYAWCGCVVDVSSSLKPINCREMGLWFDLCQNRDGRMVCQRALAYRKAIFYSKISSKRLFPADQETKSELLDVSVVVLAKFPSHPTASNKKQFQAILRQFATIQPPPGTANFGPDLLMYQPT